MMVQEQVAIVTVHYRTRTLTRRLLASVRTHLPEMPVILVDHGERTGSWENVTEVIRTGGNLGHGPGLHYGISKATTEWVLLLDSDCELTSPGLIEYLMELASSTPGVFGVGAVQTLTATLEDKQISNIIYLHPYCALIHRERYLRGVPAMDHGAPLIRTMIALEGNGLVHADRLAEFVSHRGRGTRDVVKPSYRSR